MREIEELIQRVRPFTGFRHPELFRSFLPRGYQMMTLSSVTPEERQKLILTKVKIGTLITLYDDLADHPKLRSAEILNKLYLYPFHRNRSDEPSTEIEELVATIWDEVLGDLKRLVNYQILANVFQFDLVQFYNANRYSELITDQPFLSNVAENRNYAPHNMGIILVGTVDLMASPNFSINELGQIRAFLYQAQVLARLMNVLTTYERELSQGDLTSEVAARVGSGTNIDSERVAAEIFSEMNEGLCSLERAASRLRSFDGLQYLQSLRKLYGLHEELKEVI
jgi:hypothetical protein